MNVKDYFPITLDNGVIAWFAAGPETLENVAGLLEIGGIYSTSLPKIV